MYLWHRSDRQSWWLSWYFWIFAFWSICSMNLGSKYGSQILGMCREHQSLRMFLQFFAVCDPLSWIRPGRLGKSRAAADASRATTALLRKRRDKRRKKKKVFHDCIRTFPLMKLEWLQWMMKTRKDNAGEVSGSRSIDLVIYHAWYQTGHTSIVLLVTDGPTLLLQSQRPSH